MPNQRLAVRQEQVAPLVAALEQWMRNELSTNGRTQTYRALSQMLGSVDDTLTNGVQQRAAQDASAVAGGQMTPEQTMMARLQAMSEGANATGKAAGSDVEAGLTGGEGVGAPAGIGATREFGTYGATSPSAERFGSASGNPSLQGQAQPLTANFDTAAAARRAAANAHRVAGRREVHIEAVAAGQQKPISIYRAEVTGLRLSDALEVCTALTRRGSHCTIGSDAHDVASR